MKYGKNNRIVKILMERDGMALDEAIQAVEDVANMVLYEVDSAEDILADELGLEPDYIFDLF